MRKNVAGQHVGAQLNSATDGSAVTSGTTTVYLTIDDGTQSNAGTAVHKGQGQWVFSPSQAETNGDHLIYTFVNSAAVAQAVNIYTVSFDPHDTVRLGLTALPNAAAEAAGGLYTRGTGTGQITYPANFADLGISAIIGAITRTDQVGEVASGAITAASFANNAIAAAAIAASALNGKGDWNIGKTGYSLAGTTDANLVTWKGTAPADLSAQNLVQTDVARIDGTQPKDIADPRFIGIEGAQVERPASGTTPQGFQLVIRDWQGQLVDPDGANDSERITNLNLTATALSGADRTSNITGVSRLAQGLYGGSYDVASSHAFEQVQVSCSVLKGGLNWPSAGILAVFDGVNIQRWGTLDASAMVEDSSGRRYTAKALEQAPSGGGGSSDWTAAERNQIRDALGVDGTKVSATGGQLQSVPENVLNASVETGATLRQSQRLQNAAAAGKSSGHAQGTPKYRDLADNKDRISATTDGDGNRTAVTRDVS